jgi:hypothetical protein
MRRAGQSIQRTFKSPKPLVLTPLRLIKETSKKEEVQEGEVRVGGQAQRVSRIRAKIAWDLSQECGNGPAEIARQLGVCTSAIAMATRKKEGAIKGVNFPLRPASPSFDD